MTSLASPKSERGSAVERMRGSEMDAYLKRHPTVLYRYQANRPGFVFLLVLALIAALSGLFVWRSMGLQTAWHFVVVGVTFSLAVALTGLVAYWSAYTRIHYVAASDRHLLIGRGSHVVAIEWDALDLESLDFNDGAAGPSRGVLSLELGDERYRLRLFNGFTVLDNLQGFISTLLTNVADREAA